MNEYLTVVDPYDLTIKDLNFGSITQYSTSDITFRVRNMSDIYTINNLTLELDQAGYDENFINHILLSDDGENFKTTAVLGDVSPKGVSPVITIRRVTPEDAIIGFSGVYITVYTDGWSA